MTSAEQDFRRIRFKSPETVDKRWLEQFSDEFSRSMFKFDVEADADVPFRLDTNFRLLPDLSLYVGKSSPMRTLARPEAFEAETIGLTFVLEGEAFIQFGDTDLVLGPGAAIFGSPVDLLATRLETKLLSVRLSPKILAPMLPSLADLSFVPLSVDTWPLRLLTSYLNMLNAEETIETPEARHLAALHVHDLAVLALGASRDAKVVANGRGGRAARLAAIKQDILTHLTDPNLSVASVAARHAVSPRYVHILFEHDGATYSEFVVGQRLARVHRMLTDPRLISHPIGAIALMVGFGDLSYFNRTFRRQFGATPSEVRATARFSR